MVGGFSCAAASVGRAALQRCVCAGCWPLNDGPNFDGQVCRSEVRRLEIPGGRSVPNILAVILSAEYSGEYSGGHLMAGR